MNVEEVMSTKPKEGTNAPWTSPDKDLVPGAMASAEIRAAALQKPVPNDYGPPSTLSEATKGKLRGILTGK